MKSVYQILEVANTHGGSIDYVFALLNEYEKFKGNFGIKFQPFKYDQLATKDYEWYDVYTELYFNNQQWVAIINEAKRTKDVWLDLFDNYGVEILSQNLEKIYGLKLQASVLHNYSLISKLSKIDLKDKKLIINVAAYPLDEINSLVSRIEAELNVEELLVEIGFQAYPTQLQDSGLGKIKAIKQATGKKIVFADHIEGKNTDAVMLPVLAALSGADYVEKHIMHSSLPTKYDHFSSMVLADYDVYQNKLKNYLELSSSSFLNDREVEYLRKTQVIPITSKALPAGANLSLFQDVEYKRSGKNGLSAQALHSKLNQFNILAAPIEAGVALKDENFKKATIGTIIACRLKSSRLPKKALLKIGEISSVERCIKSCLQFEHVNHTILATSTLEEDQELSEYTYSPSVVFHKGDPDDVIQRYLDISRKLKIDVIVRVTADMPYVDNTILQILLKQHFIVGADYTTAKEAAIGTNLEIINTSALEKVKQYFPKADLSEYMTWYFQNNPEHFNLNFVELDKSLVRDYRLTLDYSEDLQMFNAIEAHFKANEIDYFSLKDIYKFLDKHPEVSQVNQGLVVKYKTDSELIAKLNVGTKISANTP